MVARVLVAFALLHAALVYVPPQVWPWWLVHLGAVETCLFGAVLGLLALATTREPLVGLLGVFGLVAGLLPALLAAPAYAREGVSFSLVDWVTGGPAPAVRVETDRALDGGVMADVYHPRTVGPHPWVMIVHGGSWRSGDKGEASRVSRVLADAGFVVFDVRYRLAPGSPFPAGVADVKCAIATVAADAVAFDVDPARGALLGRSAGGQIALVAAYSDDRLPSACPGGVPALKAVVALYAPTDLAWDHANPFVPDVVDGPAALEAYLGGPPDRVPDAYRLATPMTWIDRALPATLLLHGTAERCVRPENSERLRDALVARGQSVHAVFIPLADHGFDQRPGGVGEQLARGVILAFLRREV